VSSYDAAWRAAQGRLRDRLGAARTHSWVEDVAVVEVDRTRGRATLEARSHATAKNAREFQAAVEGELAVALGLPRLSVRIFARRSPASRRPKAGRRPSDVGRVEDDFPRNEPLDRLTSRRPRPEPVAEQPAADPALPALELESGGIDARLKLSNFIVGPSNEMAFRFATAVTSEPGNPCFNPLLVHGATSSGKTHLLHAIANAFRERSPSRRVVVVSSERFTTQFSLAVRSGQAGRLRELYREADLLIIDDVHQLAGRSETEKELVHTIDELVRRRRQVVLASAFPPKHLPKLDPGLEGRLLQGLVVELKAPCETTRENLTRLRAAALKLDLDEAVIRLLVRRFERTDQILGALKRLDAHVQLSGAPVGQRVDGPEVERVLADLFRGRDDVPTPAAIASFVAQALGLDPESLKGGSRKPSVVRARQLGMALTRRLTQLTLREVGAHFGGRSCACVHFAHRKVQLMREKDPKIKSAYEEALRRFGKR
jgi:chromosomal replication initiator protein